MWRYYHHQHIGARVANLPTIKGYKGISSNSVTGSIFYIYTWNDLNWLLLKLLDIFPSSARIKTFCLSFFYRGVGLVSWIQWRTIVRERKCWQCLTNRWPKPQRLCRVRRPSLLARWRMVYWLTTLALFTLALSLWILALLASLLTPLTGKILFCQGNH